MNAETKDVAITLGHNPILKGIHLFARNGEFVGIIGPNGSGKSTLLKCVYRVLKPERGAVYLDGQALLGMSIRESAKRLAVVAQHNHTSFEFTVRDIVLMGRSPHKRTMERDTKEDYDIVNDALERAGMRAFAERDFSTLSGGEQQRIILARALAQQPQCLILDEPTNHLDIKYQLQLLNVVKRLGVTTLAAFHDLNIAAMYCDRLYAIDQGAVVAQGRPEEILTPPLIRRLYGVDAAVFRDAYSNIHITYRPSTIIEEESK